MLRVGISVNSREVKKRFNFSIEKFMIAPVIENTIFWMMLKKLKNNRKSKSNRKRFANRDDRERR